MPMQRWETIRVGNSKHQESNESGIGLITPGIEKDLGSSGHIFPEERNT